jgi:hypothetical protein
MLSLSKHGGQAYTRTLRRAIHDVLFNRVVISNELAGA